MKIIFGYDEFDNATATIGVDLLRQMAKCSQELFCQDYKNAPDDVHRNLYAAEKAKMDHVLDQIEEFEDAEDL
jgi:hypothetical protein